MKEVIVAIFTMKGCPHCKTIKDILQDKNIEYVEMDIEEHPEEYDMFVKKKGGNEYVPSLMIFEIFDKGHKVYYYAPESDYNELEEVVGIIQKHLKKID